MLLLLVARARVVAVAVVASLVTSRKSLDSGGSSSSELRWFEKSVIVKETLGFTKCFAMNSFLFLKSKILVISKRFTVWFIRIFQPKKWFCPCRFICILSRLAVTMATTDKSFSQPTLQSLWRRAVSAVGSSAAALVRTAALSFAAVDEDVDSAIQQTVIDAPAAELLVDAVVSDAAADSQAGGDDSVIDKEGDICTDVRSDAIAHGGAAVEISAVDDQAEVESEMGEAVNGQADDDDEAVDAIVEDAVAASDDESVSDDEAGVDNNDADYEVEDDDGDEDYEVDGDDDPEEEEEDDDDDEPEDEEFDAGSSALEA